MRVRYHPAFHADLPLAARVERAELDFCATAGSGAPARAMLTVGGGRALFVAAGSPLNKVLGLGLGAHVTDGEIDAIVRFYGERGEAARIELCPLAEPALAARLAARGFTLQEFENELARPLPLDGGELAEVAAGGAAGVRVSRTTSREDELWLRVVAEGFATEEDGSGTASAEALSRIEEMMRPFTQPSVVRYLAHADASAAGGGAAYVHDGVLGIFGTATIPRFRRRGVQAALVRQALEEAGDADVAIATTAPGSISQRTFERLGFNVVYTRAILVLPLHGAGAWTSTNGSA